MKIRDIITERKDAAKTGNENAKIARTAKKAKQQFKDADKGHGKRTDDVAHLLAHVRDMYGVELVDDFVDVLELPNAENDTDKETSLLSSDNRKK